jgi:hypothetical protein
MEEMVPFMEAPNPLAPTVFFFEWVVSDDTRILGLAALLNKLASTGVWTSLGWRA